jgi:hypothetical protein
MPTNATHLLHLHGKLDPSTFNGFLNFELHVDFTVRPKRTQINFN